MWEFWNNVENGIILVVGRASGSFAGRSTQSAVGSIHDGKFTKQHLSSTHIFACQCQRTVGSCERPCSPRHLAAVGISSSLRAGLDSCQLPVACRTSTDVHVDVHIHVLASYQLSTHLHLRCGSVDR